MLCAIRTLGKGQRACVDGGNWVGGRNGKRGWEILAGADMGKRDIGNRGENDVMEANSILEMRLKWVLETDVKSTL